MVDPLVANGQQPWLPLSPQCYPRRRKFDSTQHSTCCVSSSVAHLRSTALAHHRRHHCRREAPRLINGQVLRSSQHGVHSLLYELESSSDASSSMSTWTSSVKVVAVVSCSKATAITVALATTRQLAFDELEFHSVAITHSSQFRAPGIIYCPTQQPDRSTQPSSPRKSAVNLLRLALPTSTQNKASHGVCEHSWP